LGSEVHGSDDANFYEDVHRNSNPMELSQKEVGNDTEEHEGEDSKNKGL
jgi:hypothetical protein